MSKSLTRISGAAVDIMVAGSLGAVSIVVVIEYWLPILVMSTLAGIIAVVMLPWMGSRMFDDHHFERMMIIYGCATGTLATGLALLRPSLVNEPPAVTNTAWLSSPSMPSQFVS